MSSETVMDGARFIQRLNKFYSFWQTSDSIEDVANVGNDSELNALQSVDAVVIGKGAKEDDMTYSKTAAIQTWFFGLEIQDLLIVLCKDTLIFFTNSKRINILKQIEEQYKNSATIPANWIYFTRKENDEKYLEEIIEYIQKSHQGKTLGVFQKDRIEGSFGEKWQNCLNQHEFNMVDISASIGYLLSTKDDQELALIRKASEITGKLYNKQLKDQIINIVGSERKIRHSKLSENLEAALNEEKFVSKDDANHVEMSYPAIIQSGGNYNLKFSASNDKNILHFGGSSIVCAFGIRYKSYCSNLVRTLLVNPSDRVKETYQFTVECEELIIKQLKDGVQLSDVYKAVRDKVEQERPDLVNKMTTNLGTAIGIEFRENHVAITSKCTVKARKGMTFQVSVGFSNLENPDAKDDLSKKYAIFIGDTILINQDEPCTQYTLPKKDISHIAIILTDAEVQQDEVTPEPEIAPRRAALAEKSARDPMTTDGSSQEFQKELMRRLNERAEARLTSKHDQVSSEKARKMTNSYKSEGQIPADPAIRELKLYVDVRYETVILPINGTATPFHISTIKNASHVLEGDYIILRINFFHPSSFGKQADAMDKENLYIKDLKYRELYNKKDDPGAANSHLYRIRDAILDARKSFKEKEQERKQMEGVIKQDALIFNPNKANPKLKDLYIRPSLANKKINGTLEAHTNGFRYASVRGDKIDILYSNVKHAFYQSCDNEMIILIHFHLKNAIIFGKRKQLDVQFYTEVGEVTTDLGKYRNAHDKDDLFAERIERELRNKMKGAFQNFMDRVLQQKNVNFEFEQPFRALGFHGTPYRSMVMIMPTTTCLVQLTEWPPLVIVLDEVELVHFERVHFQLKNFDMALIMKDYTKKPFSIQSIPMTELDPIKKWLNSCEICYTEGQQSLNWTKIMKTITEDLESFFASGGWTFLETEGDDSQNEDGANDSDAEEEDYDPDADESVDEESESEFSGEEDEEDEDEDEDDNSSKASENLSSDEESGKSWSELEEEARRADAEKLDYDSDNGGRNKKKVAKPQKGSSSSLSVTKKRNDRSPPPSSTKKKAKR